MKQQSMLKIFAIVFILMPLCASAQQVPIKTPRYGLNTYNPRDTIKAGSKTDTSRNNNGLNSNALRMEKYLGLVEDTVSATKSRVTDIENKLKVYQGYIRADGDSAIIRVVGMIAGNKLGLVSWNTTKSYRGVLTFYTRVDTVIIISNWDEVEDSLGVIYDDKRNYGGQ